MQNIEQFVKERQEMKPLQTCESYFLTFQEKICGVSVIIFALEKTVQVDTRFYEDTGEIGFRMHQLLIEPERLLECLLLVKCVCKYYILISV